MRLPANARKVVEADLLDGKAMVLRLDDQLRIDQRPLGFELDRFKHLTLEKLEGEVDVAMRPAKQDADERVVHVGVNRTARSFDGPVVAIAGDHVRAGDLHRAGGAAQDVGVEGKIGVHVEDEIPGGRRKSGLERADRKSTRLNSSHRTISYA